MSEWTMIEPVWDKLSMDPLTPYRLGTIRWKGQLRGVIEANGNLHIAHGNPAIIEYNYPVSPTSRSETFPTAEDNKAYEVLRSDKQVLKSDWYEEDTLPPDILQDDSV